MAETDLHLVLCTVPTRESANDIAQHLVNERLAACVNVVPGLSSIFHWEGKLDHADELLLLLKTTAERMPALENRLVELHPYEVPEIIAFRANHVLEAYANWVSSETSAQ